MPYVVSSDKETPPPDVVYDHTPEVMGERRFDRADERATRASFALGGSLELVCAAVATVVAILGLGGIAPLAMLEVATIAVGAALLAQGASVVARWKAAAKKSRAGVERVEVIGGTASEILAGVAAIVLGILAFDHVSPLRLLGFAALAAAAAVLFAAAEQPRLGRLAPDRDTRARRATLIAIETGSGAMVLGGLAAGTLGVIALAVSGPTLSLMLIAMLSLGIALLITGGAVAMRFAHR